MFWKQVQYYFMKTYTLLLVGWLVGLLLLLSEPLVPVPALLALFLEIKWAVQISQKL